MTKKDRARVPRNIQCSSLLEEGKERKRFPLDKRAANIMSHAGRRIALCSLWWKTRKKFALKASLVNIVTLQVSENRASDQTGGWICARARARAHTTGRNNGGSRRMTLKTLKTQIKSQFSGWIFSRYDDSNAATIFLFSSIITPFIFIIHKRHF